MTDLEGRIKVCRYCGKTPRQIRRLRSRTGFRTFCFARGTPKGFHKYIYRLAEEGRTK